VGRRRPTAQPARRQARCRETLTWRLLMVLRVLSSCRFCDCRRQIWCSIQLNCRICCFCFQLKPHPQSDHTCSHG
jgi:hypothetical protein